MSTGSTSSHHRLTLKTSHVENRDEVKSGMKLDIHVVRAAKDTPTCLLIEDKHEATQMNIHVQELTKYIING